MKIPAILMLFSILAGRLPPVCATEDVAFTPDSGQISQPCSPNCVTVTSPHPDVTVVGKQELNDLQKKGDILIIDARRPEIVQRKGTIAGSINIPYFEIGLRYGADSLLQARHLESFGVVRIDGRNLDFEKAKKLLLFDDGLRDGGALRNIRTLMGLGYPLKKLFWYRAGMDDWTGSESSSDGAGESNE